MGGIIKERVCLSMMWTVNEQMNACRIYVVFCFPLFCCVDISFISCAKIGNKNDCYSDYRKNGVGGMCFFVDFMSQNVTVTFCDMVFIIHNA